MKIQRSSLALLVGLNLSFLGAQAAEESENPDWPCEQALVPEVSAAVVWDGPDPTPFSDQWASDAEVAGLARRLSARGTDRAHSESLIEAFAEAQPSAERDRRLTLLFAAVLDILNADRGKLLSGILRYSRDQERRARVLDSDLTQMVELEEEGSEEARQRLAELRTRVELEQRVFDDREKSIPFLCTRPRAVEQRIGELARAIASRLE
jgi:hypothetical protein